MEHLQNWVDPAHKAATGWIFTYRTFLNVHTFEVSY
ncbi:hypothetical protein AHF37_06512 [Paragonimus kellicotti]|nr:hypothetical protein AHF37_06512 [Paragonimus kellicotti]